MSIVLFPYRNCQIATLLLTEFEFNSGGKTTTIKTRYGPASGTVENVEFATPGRVAGLEHTIFFGKEADGTVDYVFDGQLVTTSFLKTNAPGDWGFATDFLRLRGAAGSATFTDFEFGTDSAAELAAVTPIPAPAVAGLTLLALTASGSCLRRILKKPVLA